MTYLPLPLPLFLSLPAFSTASSNSLLFQVPAQNGQKTSLADWNSGPLWARRETVFATWRRAELTVGGCWVVVDEGVDEVDEVVVNEEEDGDEGEEEEEEGEWWWLRQEGRL